MSSIKQFILDTFNYRHACKEFDNTRKISVDDFNLILEAARLSPSSFGFEPWKFLILQNEVLRNKILPLAWGAQRQLPSASHFIILLARKEKTMLAGSTYTTNIMKNLQNLSPDIIKTRTEFFQKFQTQDFDLTNARKIFDWSSKQLYIPLANMMTVAALLGIDSCPIEGFSQEKVNNLLATEKIIDATEFGVVAMLALGYRLPQNSTPVKTRSPLEQIVEWI